MQSTIKSNIPSESEIDALSSLFKTGPQNPWSQNKDSPFPALLVSQSFFTLVEHASFCNLRSLHRDPAKVETQNGYATFIHAASVVQNCAESIAWMDGWMRVELKLFIIAILSM